MSSKGRDSQGPPLPDTKGLVEQMWVRSNKELKLTKPEHIGASQLIWSDRCQVPEIRLLTLFLLGDPRRR
jgi:hypothetical protein